MFLFCSNIGNIETLHFTGCFFPLKYVGIVFVSSLYYSSISSYVIAESSITPVIILAKYFPFLQLHVEGFQT